MRDYAELVKGLRDCSRRNARVCMICGAKASNLCEGTKSKRMFYAADAIEELLSAVPKWISVEERLPEENKNYLTYGVFLPLGVKAMDMNRFDGTKWLTSADVEITHWMPLPKPPKEETP